MHTLKMLTDKQKATNILNYMVENLAEGVFIKKSLLKEYLAEIEFMITTD